MESILRLTGGTILLVVANIALGSLDAIVKKEFDWTTCWHGLAKGGLVLLALAAVYLAGWLNSDIFAFDVNGSTVNLEGGVHMILLATFTFYGAVVLKKLFSIMVTKVKQNMEKTSKDDDAALPDVSGNLPEEFNENINQDG